MVMYRRKNTITNVYHFVGSDHEWRRLVIEHSCDFKNTYLCDSEAIRRLYPKEVKVINSIHTGKRFQFARFRKTAVFIGQQCQTQWLTIDWSGMDYVVLRTKFKDLLALLKIGIVEKSSRKNIDYIRNYK